MEINDSCIEYSINEIHLLVEMRKNEDAERLLKSPGVVLGRSFLKAWDGR